ncbi:hypothetical protein BC833DRAFT_581015 [Globomyces pollinis-pini]|nr:hypothetical protein BC833DRAFT_581015 [Globomyces pollinis-pini]
MTNSQQQEITEIINMFLDLKPMNDIAAKLFPRHLSNVIKRFQKINDYQLQEFIAYYPGELSNAIQKLFVKIGQLDDFRTLMNLITDNRKSLCLITEDSTKNVSKETKKVAFHLLKMVRLSKEIHYVWKKVHRHQQDKSLTSLKKQFQFISFNCHAELAILKVAKDSCISKTLYIGVSKRPCYCCSLFFKEVNKSTNFNISIVTTHGKLYTKWNRIENDFEKEFNQVWVKVIEDITIRNKRMQQYSDDLMSGNSSDEDNLANIWV